jgi:hypothetical protein
MLTAILYLIFFSPGKDNGGARILFFVANTICTGCCGCILKMGFMPATMAFLHCRENK